MILTYHTGACIRASAGDTTLVFGPVSKASKTFKASNFGADVAFISVNTTDMNGTEGIARGDKEPFIISTPGEYEVKDISAAGFPTKTTYAGHEQFNTVYSVHFDGLSILYLGAINAIDLPKEVLEMDAPDILIVPVGEKTLTPAEAQKLAVKLEARIVIPILSDKTTLTHFLKEAGAEDVKPVEKLTLKPRDVADKVGEVVILEA